ncbi:MAG: type II toxin-antitoxin system RelE/ParE family toxin [Pseudomonadota bacterium]
MVPLRYTVELKSKAEKDLQAIPKKASRSLYRALSALENGLRGDIKRLTYFRLEYRLRVGNWRAL